MLTRFIAKRNELNSLLTGDDDSYARAQLVQESESVRVCVCNFFIDQITSILAYIDISFCFDYDELIDALKDSAVVVVVGYSQLFFS